MKETDRRMKDTERLIKEIGKQVGGLNNKFGKFTEDMFMDSLENLLNDRFSVQEFLPDVCKSIKNIGDRN